MKTLFHAAAILLTLCAGCQSPSFLGGRLGLGQSPAKRLAQLKEAAGQNDPSRPGLPKPTNLDPRASAASAASVDEQLRMGEAELSKDRKLEALRHFETALSVDPQHSQANHRMAVVCDKLSEFDKAEKHYKIALQNDPQSVAVLSDFGYSYWLQGRYAESERYLLQALQINPDYETAIANLGMLYGSTGRQDEALAMFRKIGDEAQVQQMMQQVAAMTVPGQTLADSTGPDDFAEDVTPAGFVDEDASQSGVSTAAFDSQEASGEFGEVNEPTREILELMEQGRRRQRLAEQAQRQDALPAQTPDPLQTIPQSPTNHAGVAAGDRAQIPGVNPFAVTPPPSASGGPGRIPDHRLNDALAAIDRDGQPPPQRHPIAIGPNHRQQPQPVDSPQMAAATPANPDSQEDWWSSNPASPPTGYERAQVPSAAPDMTPPQEASLLSGQMHSLPQARATESTGREDDRSLPHADITYGAPPSQFAEQAPVPGQTPNYAGAGGAPASEVAEWSLDQSRSHDAVRQTSGAMPEHDAGGAAELPYPDAQPVEYAHHQQQRGATDSIDLIHGTTADQTDLRSLASDPIPPTPGSEWPLVPSAESNPNDAYVQARRQAALMGLRAGPGELFPYVQQTLRATAGTSSRWNGAQYPAPARYVPPDLAVPDYHRSFEVPPVAHAELDRNAQSRPLPYETNRINHPPRYDIPHAEPQQGVNHATPGRYQVSQPHSPMGGSREIAASYQVPARPHSALPRTSMSGDQVNPNPYPPQPPAIHAAPSQEGLLKSYDDVREQHNRQLNGLVNQTYGQSPQSPPYSLAAPSSHAINTPGRAQTIPPPWNPQRSLPAGTAAAPTAAVQWTPPQIETRSMQTRSMQPSGSVAPSYTPPGGSTFIAPEPYRASRGPGPMQSPPPNQPTAQPGANAYQGPMIVPGSR